MTTRVFVETPVHAGEHVTLSPEESHYLARVRRARVGTEVELLGPGAPHRARVVSVDPRESVVLVEEAQPRPAVPPVELGLAVVDAKAALAALAHACEGGADRVVWIAAERSQGDAVVPTTHRAARVLRASLRQCGRATAPHVEGPLPLAQWLAREDPRHGLVACPGLDRRTLGPVPRSDAGARLLVGPEGGWTADELDAAHASGFARLSLGPFVLRTELAVVAALSIVLGGSRAGDAQ